MTGRLYFCESCEGATLERRLAKAKSGEYAALFFVFDAERVTPLQAMINRTLQSGLGVCLEVRFQELQKAFRQVSVWGVSAQIHLVLKFEGETRLSHFSLSFLKSAETYFKNLQRHFKSLQLHFVLAKNSKLETALQWFKKYEPDLLANAFWSAPLQLSEHHKHLPATDVYKKLRRYRKALGDLPIRPFSQLDLFNPEVHPALELESLAAPQLLTVAPPEKPVFSIVIPSYNNRAYLLCTLRHLLKQNFASEKFEVIIVDDGSNDGSQQVVLDLLREEPSTVCVQYIYFARPQAREMGDFQFRAGVARNLGVKHARGEFVVFLDSDIITPPHFLSDLQLKHGEYDVIQTKRLHLRPEKSSMLTDFHEINRDQDTVVVEEGYWDIFHAVEEWDVLPGKWKYVCTYALSMPMAAFKKVGWFRKNYCVYGYEDTDLGFRLAEAGYRFYLNKIDTYHLHHLDGRSEFKNSFYKKRLLLQHSARVFYANTLDEQVYQHLEWVLQKNLAIKLQLHDFLKTIRAYKFVGLLSRVVAWCMFKPYWFIRYQLSGAK